MYGSFKSVHADIRSREEEIKALILALLSKFFKIYSKFKRASSLPSAFMIADYRMKWGNMVF